MSVNKNRNAQSLPFLDNLPDAKIGPRNTVNWTLPNAKRSFATVGGSRNFVHDVTRTDDIAGAHASTTAKYLHMRRFAEKPHFFVPDDIDGSHPRHLVPVKERGFATLGKGDRALATRDIEHCFPESKLFATPREVNPLNPVYNLPPCQHQLEPPSPPRRDPLMIDDIEGARAKKSRFEIIRQIRDAEQQKNQQNNSAAGGGGASSSSAAAAAAGNDETDESQHQQQSQQNQTHHLHRPHFSIYDRNTLDTSDIPLSTAGSRSAARKRKSCSRMMETRDITHPPELDVEPFLKNPRGTDPLAPVYRISAPRNIHLPRDQDPAVLNSRMRAELVIGPVDGSRPRPRATGRKDRPLLSLRSDDIVGARPKHLGVIRQYEYDERNGGSKRNFHGKK